ncbi:MAG TPA: hypothetical protein VF070_43765 [Streptosporangiaceae bacterium]
MFRKAEIKQDAEMAIRQAGAPVDQVIAVVMARSSGRAELDEVMAALTGPDAGRAAPDLHSSPASLEPRIVGPVDL